MNRDTSGAGILPIVGAVLVAVTGCAAPGKKANLAIPTTPEAGTLTFQEPGGGCGDVFVHKTNPEKTAGISVFARKEKLNLSTTPQTFEIGKTDGLHVEILMGEQVNQAYCNDVVHPNRPNPQKLIGNGGRAIISISEIDTSIPRWNGNYTATVMLKDVRFIEENGTESGVTVAELIFKDIRVGWRPG